jgi:hypothetical protein
MKKIEVQVKSYVALKGKLLLSWENACENMVNILKSIHSIENLENAINSLSTKNSFLNQSFPDLESKLKTKTLLEDDRLRLKFKASRYKCHVNRCNRNCVCNLCKFVVLVEILRTCSSRCRS